MAASQRGGGQRVLVVDDSPVNQRLMIELLGKLGYDADVADNGAAAVDLVLSGRYSIVLMDCQMPEMDGYRATFEVRNHDGAPQVPIIAVTALALDEDRERVLACGMNDHLIKPIEPRRLAEVLRRWLPTSGVMPAVRAMEGNALSPAVAEAVLRHVPKQITDLRRWIDQGDNEQTARAAHRLRGSCASVGFAEMAELCAELERATVDELRLEVVVELQRAFEAVLPVLETAASANRSAKLANG